MKIKFLGGVERVTGSNFLLETDNSKIIVDCGLIQGQNTCELENFEPFCFEPKEIDLVLITHAHLDHLGKVPKLVKEGFSGKILSTLPTKDIAREIFIDEISVISENCRTLEKESLFSEDDMEKALSQWDTISYREIFDFNNVKIEFFDAGHILGSSFIKITENNGKSIIFSGDIGNSPDPLLKNTEELLDSDFIVLDSTYGDRNHEHRENRKEIFEDILETTIKHKGVLIIPAFAIDRTQEILFDIEDLIENSKIPMLQIFLDSPLAIKITEIYKKYPEYFNETARKKYLYKEILECPNTIIIRDKSDEKILYNAPTPKIIIAGSGMLTGGRILNLLKHYILDAKTTLLFVGFQVENSLGRKILEGEKNILIDGKKFKINAKIEKILSYSDHKDQKGIMDWLSPQKKNLKKIFLTHGDEKPKLALKTKIIDDFGISTYIPSKNEVVEL